MKVLFFFLLIFFSFAHEPHRTHQPVEPVSVQKITYPSIVKLHPPTVHFSVALPFATLLLGIYYVLKEKRLTFPVVMLSFLTLLFISLSVATGYPIHQKIEDLIPDKDAMDILHLHQKVGFLVLFLSTLSFLSVVFHRKSRIFMYLFLVMNLFLCVGVLYQGNLGGKLVYEHSVGVPAEGG